jgi:hypothetical protein
MSAAETRNIQYALSLSVPELLAATRPRTGGSEETGEACLCADVVCPFTAAGLASRDGGMAEWRGACTECVDVTSCAARHTHTYEVERYIVSFSISGARAGARPDPAAVIAIANRGHTSSSSDTHATRLRVRYFLHASNTMRIHDLLSLSIHTHSNARSIIPSLVTIALTMSSRSFCGADPDDFRLFARVKTPDPAASRQIRSRVEPNLPLSPAERRHVRVSGKPLLSFKLF